MNADNQTRRPAGPGKGPVLRCDDAKPLLMGYIDGELGPGDIRRIEDHLAVCVACRREEQQFRKLEEVTGEMLDEELPAYDIEVEWETLYRRLERSTGWLLLSAGLIALFGYLGWTLLNEFFLDSEAPLVVRLGVGGTLAGVIVLLVSIGRESLTKYRSERYREVQR